MKKHITTLLVLLNSLSIYGMETIDVKEMERGVDGSFVLIGPKFVKGSSRYPLGYGIYQGRYQSPREDICSAAGFDSYLIGSVEHESPGFDTTIGAIERAYLKPDGSFDEIVMSKNEYSITKLICYNGDYTKTYVADDVELDSKGIYNIINPRMFRGTDSFEISKIGLARLPNPTNGICNAMGFSGYLEGSIKNGNNHHEEKVYLREDGEFIAIVRNSDKTVGSISCYGPLKSTSVVEKDGGVYIYNGEIPSFE